MRALVIEPQVFTSLMVEDVLADEGYTSIAVAATEEEAVASALADPPDLVVAAVGLPSGSGIDAVATIRSRCNAQVLFTTQDVSAVQARAPDAPIVRKPFRPEDLRAAVAGLDHSPK